MNFPRFFPKRKTGRVQYLTLENLIMIILFMVFAVANLIREFFL